MKLTLKIFIAIWAIVVGAGTVWLTDYASRPGRVAAAPANLSNESLNQHSGNLPKLLVFIHPYCPCSRATLTELARLTEHNKGLVEVGIYFYQPSDQPKDWSRSDLWKRAAAIPKVTVETINEEDLRKFGALTSGQTLLYNAYGQLLFSGGITSARGHEGDNSGSESIENYLQNGTTTVAQTPVFGCILTTSD